MEQLIVTLFSVGLSIWDKLGDGKKPVEYYLSEAAKYKAAAGALVDSVRTAAAAEDAQFPEG